MENQNKNRNLYILVAILCVLILVLGGYIIYDKVLSNPNENKTTNANQSTESNDANNQTPENNTNVVDCSISSIKGLNLVLKNTKNNNGRITSDVYIKNKFSSNISYYNSLYNECESIIAEEIDNNYFLIKFGNDEAMFTDFYLFNKNGKYITDFKDWRKKYNNFDYSLLVGRNDNGGLLIDYLSDYGFEASLPDAYCELKAKPKDIYRITEYVSLINDELKINNTKKTTWEEAYLCKDSNTDDCGNINELTCNN